jgi:capsular exopolysaccharide synthesis family protein
MAQTAKILPLNSQGPEPSNSYAFAPEIADLSSFDIFSLLWRRKSLLLYTVFFVTLFAVLAAYQITPRFEATVRIMVGGEKAQSVGALSQVLLGGNGARSDIYGELEIMQSDRLLETAVERLGLTSDPEFNRSLLDRWSDKLAPLTNFWSRSGFGRSPIQEGDKQSNSRTGDLHMASDILKANLDIEPPRVSNVVAVTARSIDPQKAAHIANTFVDIYIADNVERRVRANAETRAWLDDRISALRKDVVNSERAVAEFLTSRRLVASGHNAISERQFAAVSTQLMTAKSVHAEKQARLSQVYKLRNSDQGLAAAKEVRASPLIQRLQDQEAALQRRVAELEPNFGERHPKMVILRADLSAARERLREEQIRIVQELENEVRVAGVKVDVLANELEKLDSERLAGGQDIVRLRQLQREAEANQRLYESYLIRLKQSGASGDAVKENLIQVVSSARVPVRPSYPRKGMIIGIGFIASLGLGIVLVLLNERLDNGFRSAEQIEIVTGMPVLGSIPRLASAEKDGRAPVEAILAAPESSYGESIRSLRTGLSVSNVDKPPKIVLVASALPGEGKTSLSVSLARQSAISSVKGNVILIDCDLRQPAVSAVMRLRAEIGLTDLFAGEASLHEVLKIDPKSGLHVLPSTPGTPNPPELLNSQHMRDLLVQLSDSYDLIIIDSPAVESVSDARILAHMADATIFVVQWAATPRTKVISSLKQLSSAGATIAGLVIHKAKATKENPYSDVKTVKA